ncbi:MAG: ankyrin repeat domain-containing protein [bacterium]
MKCCSNPTPRRTVSGASTGVEKNRRLVVALKPPSKRFTTRSVGTKAFDAAIQTYVASGQNIDDFKTLFDDYLTYSALGESRDLNTTRVELRRIFDSFEADQRLLFLSSLSPASFANITVICAVHESSMMEFLKQAQGEEDVKKVSEILSKNGLEQSDFRTLLTHYIDTKNEELVATLIQNHKQGFELQDCRTLWGFAIEQDNQHIVKLLLASKNGDVNQQFGDGGSRVTPLELAYLYKNDDIIKLLLADENVNVNQKLGSHQQTPLEIAIKNGRKDLVEILTKRKVNLNQRVGEDQTPLGLAIKLENTEIVALLLDNGADVNQNTGYYEETPLEMAYSKKNDDIIKLLLAHENVNVNQKLGYTQQTPLEIAIENEQEDIVAVLTQRQVNKVNLNQACSKRTALMVAIEKGNETIVDLLLRNGADVNQNNLCYSPLGLAIEKASANIVKLLLERKPDIDQEFLKANRCTPFELAMHRKDSPISESIIDALISQDIEIGTWGIQRLSIEKCLPHIGSSFLKRGDLTSIKTLMEMGLKFEQILGDSPDFSCLTLDESDFQNLLFIVREFQEDGPSEQSKHVITAFFEGFSLHYKLKLFQYFYFSGHEKFLDFCDPSMYQLILTQAIFESKSAQFILMLNRKIDTDSIQVIVSAFKELQPATKEQGLTCARCCIALNESSSGDDFNALKNTFQQTFQSLEDNDKLFVFWSLSTLDRASLRKCFSEMERIESEFMDRPLSEQFDLYAQTPDLLFANYSYTYQRDALFVRRAQQGGLAVDHPLPVTLQQEGQKTAEYAPFTHALKTNHYDLNEEHVLVAAKRDIGSNVVQTVSYLDEVASLFTEFSRQKNMSSRQRKEAYEVFYVMCLLFRDNVHELKQFSHDLRLFSQKPNLNFGDVIDFYHYQCEINSNNEAFIQRVEKYSKRLNYLEGLQGKMSEQANSYHMDRSPVSTKHQLIETFGTNDDFKTCLNAVTQEASGEAEKIEMLRFLFEHQAHIDDFKHTFLKLSQQRPEKMKAYFQEAQCVDLLTRTFKDKEHPSFSEDTLSLDGWRQKLEELGMSKKDIDQLFDQSHNDLSHLKRYVHSAQRRNEGLKGCEISATKNPGDLTTQRPLNEVIFVPDVQPSAIELNVESLEALVESVESVESSSQATEHSKQFFKMPISFFQVNARLSPDDLKCLIDNWKKLKDNASTKNKDYFKAVQYFKTLSFSSPEIMVHVLPSIAKYLPEDQFFNLDTLLNILKGAVRTKVHPLKFDVIGTEKVNEMLVHQLIQSFILHHKEDTFSVCMGSLQGVFTECDWNYVLKQPIQRSFGNGGGGYVNFTQFSSRAQNSHAEKYFNQ